MDTLGLTGPISRGAEPLTQGGVFWKARGVSTVKGRNTGRVRSSRCRSLPAKTAWLLAPRKEGHVGAVAFSRTGDPATGDFSDAKAIKKFGDVPDDLSAL
jgi:hypothetical protein